MLVRFQCSAVTLCDFGISYRRFGVTYLQDKFTVKVETVRPCEVSEATFSCTKCFKQAGADIYFYSGTGWG
jgi:hypothetical protein